MFGRIQRNILSRMVDGVTVILPGERDAINRLRARGVVVNYYNRHGVWTVIDVRH